jgi:hypothetical protein
MTVEPGRERLLRRPVSASTPETLMDSMVLWLLTWSIMAGPQGREGWKQVWEAIITCFPDATAETKAIVVCSHDDRGYSRSLCDAPS